MSRRMKRFQLPLSLQVVTPFLHSPPWRSPSPLNPFAEIIKRRPPYHPGPGQPGAALGSISSLLPLGCSPSHLPGRPVGGQPGSQKARRVADCGPQTQGDLSSNPTIYKLCHFRQVTSLLCPQSSRLLATGYKREASGKLTCLKRPLQSLLGTQK